jgi:hypothetical membrane protein
MKMVSIPINLKRIFEPKIAACFGALAPICAFLAIGISVALSPWFSWTNHTISDLGVSEVAYIFNLGLILTGIFLLIFAIAYIRIERHSRLGLAATIGLFFLGIGAMGIGVFSEAFIEMHILFAIICFGSLILSSILFSIRYALNRGVSQSRILLVIVLFIGILSIIIVSRIIRSPPFALSPIGIIELYKNPPPQFQTLDGKVDYPRLIEYIREQFEIRSGRKMPAVAVIELLLALPIIPWYITLSIKLHRK